MPDDLESVMKDIRDELREGGDRPRARRRLEDARAPSRYIGEGASAEFAAEVAKSGPDFRGSRVQQPGFGRGTTARGLPFLKALRDARRGDAAAVQEVEKAWVEGVDGSGGYLVGPELLPGYVEARRASSPLRERCATFEVGSNEVWTVLEGNSVQAVHTAEAATKLDSTGTVAQKVSTVHKVAGTSSISDELLADTEGVAGELVARQFGEAIGIEIDRAIISGTGTGQPTGIRNTAGVAQSAVDGQDGQALQNSILKALSRLETRFYGDNVTVALHPRDLVKWALATDAQNRYLFPAGLAGALPRGVTLVPDANVPTNLGVATNESVIIVGNFKAGAYFFERQELTVESSPDAGWSTDETVFRGVERYGFAAVVPSAFEVLTGVTP